MNAGERRRHTTMIRAIILDFPDPLAMPPQHPIGHQPHKQNIQNRPTNESVHRLIRIPEQPHSREVDDPRESTQAFLAPLNLHAHHLEIIQEVLVGLLAGIGCKAGLMAEVAVGEIVTLAAGFEVEAEEVVWG